MKYVPHRTEKIRALKKEIKRHDKQMVGCMLAMLASLFVYGVASSNGYYLFSADLDTRAISFVNIGLICALAKFQRDMRDKEDQLAELAPA